MVDFCLDDAIINTIQIQGVTIRTTLQYGSVDTSHQINKVAFFWPKKVDKLLHCVIIIIVSWQYRCIALALLTRNQGAYITGEPV